MTVAAGERVVAVAAREGVVADAVPEMRRAAENAARMRSRGAMSIRAMPCAPTRSPGIARCLDNRRSGVIGP